MPSLRWSAALLCPVCPSTHPVWPCAGVRCLCLAACCGDGEADTNEKRSSNSSGGVTPEATSAGGSDRISCFHLPLRHRTCTFPPWHSPASSYPPLPPPPSSPSTSSSQVRPPHRSIHGSHIATGQGEAFNVGSFLAQSSPYAWALTGIGLCIGLSVCGAAWRVDLWNETA